MAGRPAPGRESASRRTVKQQSQGAPLHPKAGMRQVGKGPSEQSQEMAAYLCANLLDCRNEAQLEVAAGYSPPGPVELVGLKVAATAEMRQREWTVAGKALQPEYGEDDSDDDDREEPCRELVQVYTLWQWDT